MTRIIIAALLCATVASAQASEPLLILICNGEFSTAWEGTLQGKTTDPQTIEIDPYDCVGWNCATIWPGFFPRGFTDNVSVNETTIVGQENMNDGGDQAVARITINRVSGLVSYTQMEIGKLNGGLSYTFEGTCKAGQKQF